MARFANGELFRFAAYLDFKEGEHSRGNHYHAEKVETLYLIRGRLEASYMDTRTNERQDAILEAGDLVVVRPWCAHSYRAISYTQAVELGSIPYDPEDTIALPFT